jgi:hypothetical protein
MQRRWLFLLPLGLLLIAALWPRDFSVQRADGTALRFSIEPAAPTVGEAVARLRVSSGGDAPAAPERVNLYYYPFVQRDKDSLASSDEVVRVVEADRAEDGYAAKLNLDRPGPWKVTARVPRGETPDVLATFTVHVRPSESGG